MWIHMWLPALKDLYKMASDTTPVLLSFSPSPSAPIKAKPSCNNPAFPTQLIGFQDDYQSHPWPDLGPPGSWTGNSLYWSWTSVPGHYLQHGPEPSLIWIGTSVEWSWTSSPGLDRFRHGLEPPLAWNGTPMDWNLQSLDWDLLGMGHDCIPRTGPLQTLTGISIDLTLTSMN